MKIEEIKRLEYLRKKRRDVRKKGGDLRPSQLNELIDLYEKNNPSTVDSDENVERNGREQIKVDTQ